jgi:hypothetical protein
MHQIHHALVVRRLAEICGVSPLLVEHLARGAMFPDRVRDLYVVLYGKHDYTLLDHDLASFTHFGYQWRGKLLGYCWPKDASVRMFNVPNVDVLVDTEEWIREVWPLRLRGSSSGRWASQHPQQLIVESKTSLALDEVEYATNQSMAMWLEEAVEELVAANDLEHAAFALGCQLHWLHDALQEPHAKRLLLRGHTSYESRGYDGCLKHIENGTLPYLPYPSFPGWEKAVYRAASAGLQMRDPVEASDRACRWTATVFQATDWLHA